MGALLDAVQSNDKRKALMAMRDETAVAIEKTTSGRDKAALIKRLMEVMSELEALPEPGAKKNPAQAARSRARKRNAS